jgi:hypothetical protein
VVVAAVVVDDFFVVASVVAVAVLVVAGPRSFDASVTTAAGFGRALSVCGFAVAPIAAFVGSVAAGFVAATATPAITSNAKINRRIIVKEILRRVVSARVARWYNMRADAFSGLAYTSFGTNGKDYAKIDRRSRHRSHRGNHGGGMFFIARPANVSIVIETDR